MKIYSKFLTNLSTCCFAIFIICCIISCSSKEKTVTDVHSINSYLNEDDYLELLQTYSVFEKQYQGLYNTFQYRATIHNTKILDGILWKKAIAKGWGPSKISEEQAKNRNSLVKESQIFLSFYTPQSENNLFTGPEGIWNAYITVKGKRYEGKVTKNKDPYADLVYLYPYHNRWSQSYIATFPIAMSIIEKDEVTLFITSSLGASTLKLKALSTTK